MVGSTGLSSSGHQHSHSHHAYTPSSRILTDVPCKVCHDNSSGKHYGIFACDGCAGFFKRSIRRNRQYVCKNKGQGGCQVDKTHRNQCRACRLKKCVEAGMNRDAVQHERGPRNSTIRRQMAILMKESNDILSNVYRTSPALFQRFIPPVHHHLQQAAALSLQVPTSGGFHFQNFPLQSHHELNTSDSSTPPSLSPTQSDQQSSPLEYTMPTPSRSPAQPPPSQSKLPYDISSFVNSPETVCETAARLLFMCVRWAKSIPSFVNLDMTDQLSLLEESWRDIFILSAAQYQLSIDIGPLMTNAGLTPDQCQSDKLFKTMTEIKNLQDIILKFKQAQVDATEYACLKAVSLFKTNEMSSASSSTSTLDSSGSRPGSPADKSAQLKDLTHIQTIQEQTQVTLSKYETQMYPTQPFRFGKLLILLPMLKGVSTQTIEQVFFKKTIGNISIDRVILDMYKSQVTH
uniref:Nuclear receptor n=1 Tax=Brachionus rotundiformis TaxID=96890 RepID=A0A221CAY7_9BILA|nr:nuclear receptor [Brachionus rotundiformis]